jgi:tripartite-type tricarboxylate transporter receptor subunit TctC
MRFVFLGMLFVCLAFTTNAFSQKYPQRPVGLIAPFPRGGLSDVPARIMVGGVRLAMARLTLAAIVSEITNRTIPN